ncbi:MAG TPA: hypothetical protein VHF26_14450 [Trebonia sp.]|nr:hypothetical protein [Trebonia sp.]
MNRKLRDKAVRGSALAAAGVLLSGGIVAELAVAGGQAEAATATPAKPVITGFTNVNGTGFTVNWKALPAGETAEIEAYNATSRQGYGHYIGLTGTSYTFTGLPVGTAVDVMMAGDAGGRSSGWSAPVLAFTQATVTATATTSIYDDTDTTQHGPWAVDTLTRNMVITRHGQVAASNCGGTATNGITSCWFYTAQMTDNGTFKTIAGADSPQAGTPIAGTLAGTLIGGSAYEFYATSGTPDASLVPTTFDADANGGTNSTDWPERFFPGNGATSFGDMNEINWTYTYNAPSTCETWTDAYNNSSGALPADGDITGVNHCGAAPS